jgi:hypothetical protein
MTLDRRVVLPLLIAVFALIQIYAAYTVTTDHKTPDTKQTTCAIDDVQCRLKESNGR